MSLTESFNTEHASRAELLASTQQGLNALYKKLQDQDLASIDVFEITNQIDSIVTGTKEPKVAQDGDGIEYEVFGQPFFVWERAANGKTLMKDVGSKLLDGYAKKKYSAEAVTKRLPRLVISTHYFGDGNGRSSRAINALFQKLLEKNGQEFTEAEVTSILGINKRANVQSGENKYQGDEENRQSYSALVLALRKFISEKYPNDLSNFTESDFVVPKDGIRKLASEVMASRFVQGILDNPVVAKLNFDGRLQTKIERNRNDPYLQMFYGRQEQAPKYQNLGSIIADFLHDPTLGKLQMALKEPTALPVPAEEFAKYIIESILFKKLQSIDMVEYGFKAISIDPQDQQRNELDNAEFTQLVEVLTKAFVVYDPDAELKQQKNEIKDKFIEFFVLEAEDEFVSTVAN